MPKTLFTLFLLTVAPLNLASAEVLIDSPQITSEPLEVIYEIPTNKTKSESFKLARNFFAEKYEDSNQAIKVVDESDGMIIGKSQVDWQLTINEMVINCQSGYSFQFISVNNLATLKLKLENKAPSTSKCKGWDLPSKKGYIKIMANLELLGLQLAESIQEKSSLKIRRAFKQ